MSLSKIKLLQAISGGKNGGAEEFFVRLAIAFERAGLSQRVLVRDGRPWVKPMLVEGIDVVPISFRSNFSISSRRHFRKQIRDFEPTHILTWMNRATRIGSGLEKNIPYTHLARLGGYYKIKNYKKCDHLIGNTKKIVSYVLDNGWPKERAHYLPNFVYSAQGDAISRSLLNTPLEVPLLLGLGRYHRNKGFDVLIEALTFLPTAYLWIAGEGPEKVKLQKQASELGVSERVRFLGWRNDVPALLAAADIFVCSSRIEPLGNIILEAWASRTPVVAASADGPIELIQSGNNGLLVPLEDPEGLSSAIKTLLNNYSIRDRLVEAGYQTYYESFEESNVVAKYISLFTNTLKA